MFATRLGWQVDALDFSEAGQRKALHLAAQYCVDVTYAIADLLTFAGVGQYGALAFIFVHLPPEPRRQMLIHLTSFLKPGGLLLLEGFHPKQNGLLSGGPSAPGFCYTTDELRATLGEALVIDHLTDWAVVLAEGAYHSGPAHITRLVATKR